MSNQPTVPAPGPTPSLAEQLPAIIARIQASQTGTSAASQPIVPLWKVRPHAGAAGGVATGFKIGARRPTAGNANPLLMKPSAFAAGTDASVSIGSAPEYATADSAEASFLDMSVDDRMEFAKKAQQAGLWKPSQGADGLATAWSRVVSMAASYNSTHSDKSKWISPWEATSKLAIQSLADEGSSLDGYTRTTTQAKQYSTDELYQTARQVLQQELGRDPSDSELNAYTIAVNKASAANPQTTVTTYGPMDPNTGERTSAAEVQGPGFDPSKTITDLAQGTQEHDAYQAAAVYFPALMQALNAVV